MYEYTKVYIHTHGVYRCPKRWKKNSMCLCYYKARKSMKIPHITTPLTAAATTADINTHDLCKIESFLLFKCSHFAMAMADSITLCVRFKRLNYSIEAWKIFKIFIYRLAHVHTHRHKWCPKYYKVIFIILFYFVSLFICWYSD